MRNKKVLISGSVTFSICIVYLFYGNYINSIVDFLIFSYLSVIVAMIVGSIFDGSFGGGSNGDHWGGSGGHLG